MGSDEQGIVHMVGPETGLTQPGKQSFVVIHILPRMGPLVQLHLVLGQVKLNMYLLLKHFGKLNLKFKDRRYRSITKRRLCERYYLVSY